MSNRSIFFCSVFNCLLLLLLLLLLFNKGCLLYKPTVPNVQTFPPLLQNHRIPPRNTLRQYCRQRNVCKRTKLRPWSRPRLGPFSRNLFCKNIMHHSVTCHFKSVDEFQLSNTILTGCGCKRNIFSFIPRCCTLLTQ